MPKLFLSQNICHSQFTLALLFTDKLIPESFLENEQKVEASLFEYPDKHLGVEIYYRTLVTFHITVAH